MKGGKIMFKRLLIGATIALASVANAAAIAAPDMTDATGSVTNVFGAKRTLKLGSF